MNNNREIVRSRSQLFSVLVVAIFIIYSYATGGLIKYIFGNYRNASATLIVCVFLLLANELARRKRIAVHSDLLIYIILSLVVFHNNANLKNGDIVNAVLTVGVFILAVILRRVDRWEFAVAKIIIFASGINALVSIAFGLMPSFYMSRIIPLFTDSNQLNLTHLQSKGILCGLTNSNSFNAILMVNGLAFISAFLITKTPLTKRVWLDRLVALLFLIVLLMTGKRGPLVFCVAAIFVAYLVYNSDKAISRWMRVVGITLFLLIVWIIGSSMFPQLFPSIGRLIDTDSIDVVRLALYNQAINVFRNHTLVGIGWDAFRYNYLTFGNALNVHNIYIQLLCECGIIGAIPFFGYFLLNIRSAIKKLRKKRSGKEHDHYDELVLTISVLYQVFFLMYGLTGNPLYDAPTLLVYVICCAAAAKIKTTIN